MKILIFLKPTPDTETKIKISADGKKIDHTETKFIINPYDEFAIEEALKTKEKIGAGEVVVVSFYDDRCKDSLIKALAMGADRAVQVQTVDGVDDLGVAKVLAAVAKAENAEIIFCGRQAIDDDNMHIHAMTAEILGWPHINVVTKFELNGKNATVEREVEGGMVEIYDVELPAIIGAHKSLNSPRYASLPGIMKAKKKPFDIKKSSDFGIDEATLKNSWVKVASYVLPPSKPAGKIFAGEAVDVMIGKVVKLLREEAKVI